MKFLSIDIETTGLDKDVDQILHVAAVLEDTEVRPLPPVKDLPTFERALRHERIKGNVHALAMNADLIRAMSAAGDSTGVAHNGRVVPLVGAHRWWDHFVAWFHGQLFPQNAYTLLALRPNITVAGKNAAGFDLPFISANVGDRFEGVFHYRVIDPASVAMGMYPDWWGEGGLDALPSLGELRRRLDIHELEFEPEYEHDALHDARAVIEILRRLR